MTRIITHGGVTSAHPGAYSKVDFSAGARPSTSAVGIIGIVGEADLGEPGKVLVFDDDKTMRSYFGSGPLADAAGRLFKSSTSPDIVAGASRVFAYKPNASTPSQLPLFAGDAILGGAVGSPVQTSNNNDNGEITLTDPGTAFTGLDLVGQVVYINSGKGAGQRRVIVSHDDSKLVLGDSGSGLEWTSEPSSTSTYQIFKTQVVLTSSNFGALMNTLNIDLDYTDPRGTFAFETRLGSTLDLDSGNLGGFMFDLTYTGTLAAVTEVDDLSNTTGATATVIELTNTDILTDDVYNNFFMYRPDTKDFRKITDTDSTTDEITISAAVNIAATDPVEIRSGIVAVADVSGVTSGSVFALGTGQDGIVPALNDLEGLTAVVISGRGAGQQRRVVSNDAGASPSVTVSPAFSTSLDTTSVIEFHHINAAAAAIEGSAGKATSLVAASVVNDSPVEAEALTAAASGNSTTTFVKDSAFSADPTGSFIYIPSTREMKYVIAWNGTDTATIAGEWAAAPNSLAASVIAPERSVAISAEQTLEDFITTVNADAAFSASAGTGVNTQKTLPSTLDFADSNKSVDIQSEADNGFTYHLQQFINALNNQSEYVTAERADTDGSGLPDATTTPLDFFGAIRGTSTNADWQSGFDALLLHRVNHVTAAISKDLSNDGLGSTASVLSVHQMLSSHVDTATLDKSERTGFAAIDGTKEEILSARAALANFKVQLSCQQIETTNAAGDLKTFDAWMSAVSAASMRAGAQDNSLTFKTVTANNVTQDSSWDPRNKTDNRDLLLGGVLFMEPTPTGEFRWVRDITTEISQDNTLLNVGATVWNWFQTVYNARTAVENEFTGDAAQPAIIGRVRQFLADTLGQEEAAGRISKSIFADGTTTPAFEIQSITVNGDVMRIRYKISVTGYVDFILIDESLELPTLEG